MNNQSPEKLKLAQQKASRGFLYQNQGKSEAAISLYQEALSLVPNLPFVHYNLGLIFHHQGNLPTAFTNYQESITLNPNHIKSHYNFAIVLQQQGLLDKAISSYQKVINLSQTSSENILIQVQAYRQWGNILFKEGEYKETIEILQQAITKKPDDAPLYNDLGKVFLKLGQVEKAIVNYQKALALQPQLILGRYNLGKACQKQGWYSEAIVHFQEVIKQQPENISAYSDCGLSFLELGKIEAAIPYLQKVINNNPFVESYCKETDLLTESDTLKKAQITCTKFLRTLQKSDLAAVRKNLTLIYLYLGDVLFEYGEYSEAENYYKKALEFQPFNVDLYIKLGDSLVKQERFNTAIIVYHLGLAFLPDNHSINEALERALATRNNSSQISNADGIKRIFNLELEEKFLSTNVELGHRENLLEDLIPRKFMFGLNNEVFNLKTDNFGEKNILFPLKPNSQDPTPKLPKKLESSNEKIPETKCQGLNCKSCLKRIFKKLQPIDLGNSIHTFSTTEIEGFTNISSVDFPETPKFVIEVENGRAWIVPQKNDWMVCNAIAIINENNQLLAEVSREYPGQLPGCEKYDINNHQFLTTEKLPPLEQIDGTVAVLSGLSGNVYFHWMVDILPRIEILRRHNINFENIDWFLINSIQQPFQKETLQILGIPEEKIIESDRYPYIQAQKLIVPSFASHLGWLEKSALEFSRQTFLNKSNITWLEDSLASEKTLNNQVNYSYPERIYITRHKAKYRKVINEQKVVDLLNQYGFTTIELETISVVEQVRLFANAKVIVSPHGSGLTNIMFCKPGTTVIELVSPNYIRHYYWVISKQLQLKYYYLLGEENSDRVIRTIMYPNPLTENILISLSKLEKILSQAGMIKIDSQKKLNFLSREKTSAEMIIFGKKVYNTTIDTSSCQKQEGYNTNQTLVSDSMSSKVNLAKAAVHFHKKALLYIDQNKLDEAKAACEQVLKNQPEFAPAYKTMGIIFQKQGQIEVAFDWYLRAIKMQPDFAEAYVNIGTIYAKKQQWQEAINYYQKAISLKSDLTPAYRNIIKAYKKLGKVAEAVNYQYKFYFLEPEKITEPECINLGNTLLQHKQFTEAISCYRSVLKLNPNSAVAYQNLAGALSQTGDFEESNICYQKAIKLGITNSLNVNQNSEQKSPNLSSVNSVISTDLDEINPHQKEHKNQETSPENNNNKLINLTVNQYTVEAYKQLGKTLQNQNKPVEAWQWYTKAISITPKDPEIYRDLGSLYGQQQQWQEAIKCYQKALKINPNMVDVYRYLATAYQNLGEALKIKSHTKNLNLQSKNPASPNYLNPHVHSMKDNKDNIANNYYYSKINNYQINHDNPKLINKSNFFQEIIRHFERFLNNLASEVTSVFHRNNQSSKKMPILEGKNNYFPSKKAIDLNLKDTTDFPLEDLLLYEEKKSSNTNEKKQEKRTQQQVYQTQNLSPSDQVEDSQKKTMEVNTDVIDVPASKTTPIDVYIQRATAYKQEGLYEQAIAECQQAIAVKPDLAIAYKILANIQQKMGSSGQRQKAKENYLKAISLDSQDASIHSNLGSLYAQEALWGKAIPCYQKAIALKPDFVGAYRNLAKAWSQLDRKAEAADCWYQAYTLEPENTTPEQYLNLGNTLGRQDQFTKAIFCYQQAIKLKPNYAAAYHNLAVILKRQGKLDEAIIYEQKAKEVDNNTVEKQVAVNTSQPQNINPEDILQSFSDKKGKDKSPQANQVNLIKQAEANLVNGKFSEAIRTCEEIISIKPHAVAYQIMGKAWVEMNKIDAAIAAYQKSLEVKPDVAEVYVSLGELYVKQQREEEAITAYQKAIKLAPDLKDSYRSLVELLLKQGKVDEAVELSYNALIQHPSWTTPQELCNLANSLIVEGKIHQGITCFEQAIKLDPKFLEAHYSLGKIFSSQQNWGEAAKYYRQAVELNPKFIEPIWDLY